MTNHTRKRLAKLCGLIFAVGFVNFFTFVIGAWWIGGDAWQGKVEGHRYYLGKRGQLKEVSAAVYTYSRLHILSLIVTQPIAIAAAILAGALERRRDETSKSEE
jgi:hypothetical protein